MLILLHKHSMTDIQSRMHCFKQNHTAIWQMVQSGPFLMVGYAGDASLSNKYCLFMENTGLAFTESCALKDTDLHFP